MLVLAPEEGLGVTDPVMRERLLDQIRRIDDRTAGRDRLVWSILLYPF